METEYVRLAGQSVTPSQLKVLQGIEACEAPPKIGRFHRMTEKHLEKARLIRRVRYEPDPKIPAWALTEFGHRVLEAGAAAGNLPAAASPTGVANERI